jgi:hypothetical protein
VEGLILDVGCGTPPEIVSSFQDRRHMAKHTLDRLGGTPFRSMCSSVLVLIVVIPAGVSAQSIGFVRTARHTLEFSGAVVAVTQRFRAWPIADRTFTLTGLDGRVLSLRLHKGGGALGNTGVNLFAADGDRYYVLSERDCVEFDPVRFVARYCAYRPACESGSVSGLRYLGRFDWMNGFDRPGRTFGLAFRYLPAEDAVEAGSCPTGP